MLKMRMNITRIRCGCFFRKLARKPKRGRRMSRNQRTQKSIDHIKNSVTSKQYEELKNAFIAFDRNCDGFIDSEDLGYVMGKLGHDLSSKEVKKVFKDICKHSNGKMDFTDFVEMMAQDKLVLTTSEQEILAAFQFLDQNHDGYITIDELLQRFHGCLSDTEASRLMCEADANGDGKIDFNEFKHMMFNQERSISLAQSEVELYS
ncbi:uncharacterized protein [Clytia hemisphaerica]